MLLNASECDAVFGEHEAVCHAQGGGAGLSSRQFGAGEKSEEKGDASTDARWGKGRVARWNGRLKRQARVSWPVDAHRALGQD